MGRLGIVVFTLAFVVSLCTIYFLFIASIERYFVSFSLPVMVLFCFAIGASMYLIIAVKRRWVQLNHISTRLCILSCLAGFSTACLLFITFHFFSPSSLIVDVPASQPSSLESGRKPIEPEPSSPSPDNGTPYIGRQSYPEFPLAGFPNPSSYARVAAYFFGSARSLGEVGLEIERSAIAAGYPGLRYYSTYGNRGPGLVMLSDLERIDNNGVRTGLRPFEIDAMHIIPALTVSNFLEYLFTSPPGRYRFILVWVSDDDPVIVETPLTRGFAEELLHQGAPYIDGWLFNMPVTSQTDVHFLIYEFSKPQDSAPIFLGPGRLSSHTHLIGSRILDEHILSR